MSSAIHAADELWQITSGRPHIDAEALARAVLQAAGDIGDFRTRLLIRQSIAALNHHWGEARTEAWIINSACGEQIRSICGSDANEASDEPDGFPSLARRIMDSTKPEVVMQFLRELSLHVAQPTQLFIGGSIALMLDGHMVRHTEDIYLVDELPAAIRAQHDLLEALAGRYGLNLARFQSHYLPQGWRERMRSVAVFGHLQVFALDVYDVFLSKLFSNREKDRDDLREVARHLDTVALKHRLVEASALRAEPKLYDAARRNWFILFGEGLPN